MTADPYNLRRFADLQDGKMARVLAELRAGRKQTHWMWFVFPQLKGLGSSSMANEFGLASKAEAEAYLKHSVLGPRLVECTKLANRIEGSTAEDIFDYPDYLKFRSCMTLFAEIAGEEGVFVEALVKYFEGRPDIRTLDLLYPAL